MQLLYVLRFAVILLGSALIGSLVALGVHFYGLSKPKASKAREYGSDIAWLVFIIAVFTVGGLGAGLITSLQTDNTPAPTRIPSALTVRTAAGEDIEINFYWDVLGQNRITSLDYGEIEEMGSSSLETWVRNEALIDVWLTLSWENLIPVDADHYINLSWDWVKLIDTWTAYSDVFRIENAQLVCEEIIIDPIIISRAASAFNYEITTRTKVETSVGHRPETQIVFRYVDAQNYYFAGIGAWGYKASIGKVVNGVVTRIAETGNPNYVDINLEQWYDLKVRVAGSTFTVYIDGEEQCTAEDTNIGFGAVGLRALYSKVIWDSFVVVDAFDTENILFQDYFVGSPLKVSTSRKVTFTVTSIAAAPIPGPPTVSWTFYFGSVVTSYDNPREIKYPIP